MRTILIKKRPATEKPPVPSYPKNKVKILVSGSKKYIKNSLKAKIEDFVPGKILWIVEDKKCKPVEILDVFVKRVHLTDGKTVLLRTIKYFMKQCYIEPLPFLSLNEEKK